VNDGIAVEIIHGGHEAILDLLLGCDADVAQDGAGSLEKKPSTRLSQEPCLGVKVSDDRLGGEALVSISLIAVIATCLLLRNASLISVNPT
jgi:hypothetical protein